MSGSAVLGRVAAALGAAGVPFMLTGSMAAAYHGAPRATLDIDLVIDATDAQLRLVVTQLVESGLYASDDAALEARRVEGMFNVIDSTTGWKVDLICCKSRAFSQTEFARRVSASLDGVSVSVATLEDVILSKLEWARLGGSARQLEDVATLLAVREAEIDRAYLDRWVAALDVSEQWRAALALRDRAPR